VIVAGSGFSSVPARGGLGNANSAAAAQIGSIPLARHGVASGGDIGAVASCYKAAAVRDGRPFKWQ